MRKFLLSMALVLCTIGAMAQSTINFTFTRNGENATVNVEGADGVTATIEATSPSPQNNATKTGIWNTGEKMGTDTNILCTSTNTSAATTPITYTLTVNGLNAYMNLSSVVFKHITANASGEYQPNSGDGRDTRHCNFVLDVNGSQVASKTDFDIWIQAAAGNTGKDVAFEGISGIKANDGTLTIKLSISKGTNNNGCFYGLKNVAITLVEPAFAISKQLTATDLMNATEHIYIAIKNLSYTNNRWFVGNTGELPYSEEEFTNNAVFVWEPVTENTAGSYRLKKLNGDYMAAETRDNKEYVVFGTADEAVAFTATAPGTEETFNGDADSKPYIADNNDANLVRFVKGSNWINVQNGANGIPQYNDGKGGWTIHYVYELTEAEAYEASITDAGYATFYAPANVEIPEGVKAYYITTEGVNTDYVSMTEITTGVIPANTAVVLEGTEDNYVFNVSDADATAVSGNLLKGTLTSTNVIGDAYVLSNPGEGVGLYKTQMTEIQLSSTSGKVNVFLNNAGKAYLPASAVPAAAQASNGFRFGEGTTGIDEITDNRVQSTVIYDLTGRRVETISAPGIYIVGGKKVLVK